MSTGMTSPAHSLSARITLITPLEAPTKIPTGPFKLSTQPKEDNFHDSVRLDRVIFKLCSTAVCTIKNMLIFSRGGVTSQRIYKRSSTNDVMIKTFWLADE